MFSECFIVFLALFDIYSREPDFWAENQIFKNFSKSLKTCLVCVFWEFHGIFSIIQHLSREPDFSAKNRILKKFLKCLKACLVGVFWVFQSYFSIVRHLGREPDFWAENRIFKKFLKSLKTCLVGVFWVFQDIEHSSKSEPRTGFLSREPDFHEFLKKPQNMFGWCFLSVSWYFSIIRHMSREPDFSANNRIFKNFLKCLKACLVGVFWVFQGIFLA